MYTGSQASQSVHTASRISPVCRSTGNSYVPSGLAEQDWAIATKSISASTTSRGFLGMASKYMSPLCDATARNTSGWRHRQHQGPVSTAGLPHDPPVAGIWLCPIRPVDIRHELLGDMILILSCGWRIDVLTAPVARRTVGHDQDGFWRAFSDNALHRFRETGHP